MDIESAEKIDHTPTPHNAAKKGQIAPFVLFPGDPGRAEYIAKNYFENPTLVSCIRGIPAYTGTYKGKPVSVMASGMGCCSAGIYSYELFKFYDVETIVRIGTCGGYQEWIEPGNLIMSQTCSSDSAYGKQYDLPGNLSPCADFELLYKAVTYAKQNGIGYAAGPTFSSDFFSQYNALGPDKTWKRWADMGCLGQDNETYALYCNAAFLHKKALSILTDVWCCKTHRSYDTTGFKPLDPMIKTALSLV